MPPRCPPPELMEMEDLVQELVVRIPPDDPASLVRAALVNKRWCRLICGRRFRRRYREFHGAPPLLGVFRQRSDRTVVERLFIPSSSFHPRDHADRRSFQAVHSCHGRVLLRAETECSFTGVIPEDLFVWDPVTDKLQKLPRWPLDMFTCAWNAAVLCASVSVAGGGCDHLDCIDGPFIVVFVGNRVFGIDGVSKTFTCVYSSEDDRWSESMHAYTVRPYSRFDEGNAVLAGNAVYFKCFSVTPDGRETGILMYDLLTQEVSSIQIPTVGILEHIHDEDTASVLMATEHGRLGLAFTLCTSTKPKLYLCSRKPGPDGDAGCGESRVIHLDKLIQTEINRSTRLVAFADNGAGGLFFIWTGDGLFSLNLKSGSSKSLGGSFGDGRVVPYMSFCTPALGAICIDEAPEGSEPSA